MSWRLEIVWRCGLPEDPGGLSPELWMRRRGGLRPPCLIVLGLARIMWLTMRQRTGWPRIDVVDYPIVVSW